MTHGISRRHVCSPPLQWHTALAVSAVVITLSLKWRRGTITFHLLCSCDLDLDPMTFTYKLDPHSLEIHRMCKYEHPTSRLSKVIVWQTDRHDRNYHTALWVVNKRKQKCCLKDKSSQHFTTCHSITQTNVLVSVCNSLTTYNKVDNTFHAIGSQQQTTIRSLRRGLDHPWR